MQEQLSSLLTKAAAELPGIKTRPEFEAAKARLVGPNGELTALMKQMGAVPKEERPIVGRLVNETKGRLQALLDAAVRRIEDGEIAAQLGPAPDPTLPSPDPGPGTYHPLTQVREEMCRILRKVGFAVADGPEVETEFYCFDALNTPPDHPARDPQDTFYFPDNARFGNVSPRNPGEKYLLRTHTSSVQIRTMLKGPPPIRIVSPGRVYRRDTSDATHSANFHQLECLYVDRNVTVRDLKALLDYIFSALLGPCDQNPLPAALFRLHRAELRSRPVRHPSAEGEEGMDRDRRLRHRRPVGIRGGGLRPRSLDRLRLRHGDRAPGDAALRDR